MVAVSFPLRYDPDVKSVDIPLLDAKLRTRIRKAIEMRLREAPHLYGHPLRKTLRGYWKLRIGDYRVIYRIVNKEVWVSEIYSQKKGL